MCISLKIGLLSANVVLRIGKSETETAPPNPHSPLILSFIYLINKMSNPNKLYVKLLPKYKVETVLSDVSLTVSCCDIPLMPMVSNMEGKIILWKFNIM